MTVTDRLRIRQNAKYYNLLIIVIINSLTLKPTVIIIIAVPTLSTPVVKKLKTATASQSIKPNEIMVRAPFLFEQ